ncbi:MAG: hypothetical protein QOI40_1118, partial [Alphaproteobacteria bacterium]|nr:hypothetical protein [Alphaproteobacteria bacterium]
MIPMELAGYRASFTDSPLGEAKMRSLRLHPTAQ